ncbi:MAG: LarC family nickel insertion protein [Desulfotomaculaceae bacterium]|nr:LarC family nickel insertion protein [Desulfotomaculaceae bacterium]
MRIAYFDCFSGISGDMCMGALVSAGVDFALLKEELAKMPVAGYDMRCKKEKRNGIACVNIFVDLLETEQPARRLADILQIIAGSDLPAAVKDKSREVFIRLAAAEAAVHDTTPEQIHFHEVGAVDAIVDVTGAVLGLHLLKVDKVYVSPLPMGKGFIKCMHGVIPSPAPATLEILHGVPVYGTGIAGELVTPTGAALLSVLADAFIDLPAMIIEKVGYGAGKKVMEHPNLLRLIVGEHCQAEIQSPIPCHCCHHREHRHAHLHDHKPAHTNTHEHKHGHVHHSHQHEYGHDHDHNQEHDHGHSHEKSE